MKYVASIGLSKQLTDTVGEKVALSMMDEDLRTAYANFLSNKIREDGKHIDLALYTFGISTPLELNKTEDEVASVMAEKQVYTFELTPKEFEEVREVLEKYMK